ncbi:MAG: aminoglycoside phosphotransferase family protein [Flavobacteriaceae bacterium]|nr:aminoglycoside phosphotransferase family protein [Bacteroidia bacterium]NNF74983.1 aminoglycoside phosphotransferase family protein [Flavobacteriaceae bacterium]
MNTELLQQVVQGFGIQAERAVFDPVKHGYINDTFILKLDGKAAYVIQRINHHVFQDPKKLQENIDKALKKLNGKDYLKIDFLKSINGSTLFQIKNTFWRVMRYIPDSTVYNNANDEIIAFEAGLLIGNFHKLMAGENVNDYHVTITDFHSLKFRITQFQQALDYADHLTLMDAQEEVNFAFSTIPKFKDLDLSLLPHRVCHNDAKLNNMLFDSQKKGLCMIDLDTIMPGYFHYDLGDAVRTVVNPASEDETDLSQIEFRMDLYDSFMNGLKDSGLSLLNEEIKVMPLGISYMPFLHGLRALTDFLNGNIYYKVNYAEHNLDRAKNLFQFTKLAVEYNSILTDKTQLFD